MMKLSRLLSTGLPVLFAVPAFAALQSGIDLSNADMSVRPQDDIYLAINGTWLKNTEIPADKSNYGAFTALEDLSRERIKAIIEECAAKENVKGSDAQKVGDLYRAFMDEKAIEAKGLQPLEKELAAIAALKTPSEVAAHFGVLQKLGVQGPFAFGVGQDDKDSTHYLAIVYQSGTGLPDRDYYLKDEQKFADARAAYTTYIGTLLTLAGEKPEAAVAAATEILALETKFAKVQRTRTELRDPEKNYNKMPVAKLLETAPGFDWTAFLGAMNAGAATEVNLGQPDFAQKAAAEMKDVSLATWKQYMTFKLLDSYVVALPEAFRKASFELHGRVLAGLKEEKLRWKQAVDTIGGAGAGSFGVLGDALGRIYVAKHFPAESKLRMEQLVKNLLTAYDKSISDLTWMSPETKAKAREKLSKYTTKIGYTEDFRDYSKLEVSATDLMGDLIASSDLEFNRDLAKLGQPVNRKEWGMTPQTVNAYYNQSMNEIVFPAAILQAPFFNPEADDAVNYGGIGAVIGHEISHGFDDSGAQYDGDGNMKNWWTEADQKAFKELTQRLVAQYSACEALPGKFVNGELTLGENIADLSGLAIAYKAYHLSLGDKEAPVIDGYTGDQRFFMGWSQVWRRKYREPELQRRLLIDPHSPSQFRATVPVMNNDAFYKAFDVKPGDKAYKTEAERIKIW